MQQHVFAISNTCELLGIKHAVICPGSRSAPLVFAFAKQKKIKCYTVVDERSAGFMALGIAQQLQQPVVLICTSGTAALNFFPAIAEAFYQKIPLLILTADRPPELINQQDGQMIMQKNVYGKHVIASLELPCYTRGKENFDETIRILSKAISKSNGLTKGPVHINIPLNEPLYPGKVKQRGSKIQSEAFINLSTSRSQHLTISPTRQLTSSTSHLLENAWQTSRKKLILIGQHPVDNNLYSAFYDLIKQKEAVILSDVLSNKQSICSAPHFDFIISNEDKKILKKLEPGLIISFGGPMVSKELKLWLKNQKPKHHFRIQKEKEKVDTYNNVTSVIGADKTEVFKFLSQIKTKHRDHDYNKFWHVLNFEAETCIKKFIQQGNFSEIKAAEIIMKKIPYAANVQVANSSIIRYMSLLGNINHGWIMNGNRGTSGIDGCTSTAVGAALINGRLTCLLTGDLGFLYDRNALWNHHVPKNLRIIVFNNSGGGIFKLINGPSQYPEQIDYFTTPHHQNMKSIAVENGLEYYFCDDEKNLNRHLKSFFGLKESAAVLEIKFDMDKNAEVFKKFKQIKLA